MSFYGMDPEQVRNHAQHSADAARRLADLQQRLDGIVQGVQWQGPDREAFVQQWTAGPRTELGRAGEWLDEDGAQLRDEADQQDQASSADGAGSGSGGGGIEPAGEPSWFDRAKDWLGDRAADVGDWVAERTSDLREWWGGTVDRALDGLLSDRPFAEIAAEQIVNRLVDSGALTERSGVDVEALRVITGSEAPQNLADLVLDNDETRRTIATDPPREYQPDNRAQVRIQSVTGADGVERYIVHVPPTQGAPLMVNKKFLGFDVPDVSRILDGWDSQGQPFGWDNNLYSMAGRDNAGAEAVKAAMAEAGIPPGAQVAMVAHSQGGLVASQLSNDPSFNGEMYQVTDVFSVGSPVQTYTPANSGTDVLNVKHVGNGDWKGDFVPDLDLEGRSARHPGGNPAPNVTDLAIGTPPPSAGYPTPDPNHAAHDSVLWDENHSRPDPNSAYYGTVRNNADDPTLAAKSDRMQGLYFGDGTTMNNDVVVDVSRLPG